MHTTKEGEKTAQTPAKAAAKVSAPAKAKAAGSAAAAKASAPAPTPAHTPAPTPAHTPAPTPQPDKKKFAVKVSATASVNKNQAQAEQQSMSMARKSLIFLACVGLCYLLFLILSGQIDEFISALRDIDTNWVFAAILCYGAYYIFGVLAYVLAVAGDPKCPVGVRDLMSVEASGIFFYNLTPNGAGGPPSQIFRLTRAGLSVAQAGALQYTRFILYEAGEGIFAAIMMIFRGSFFLETYGDVFYIGAFLFAFKILEVIGLLAICMWPQSIASFGGWGLRMLAHFPWFRERAAGFAETLNTQILEFATGFNQAIKNTSEMALTLFVTLLQLGCLYALPYFVLRAFDLPADLLTCLACGSMLELLTSAIPLPGGTFGAEGGFAFLFMPMFGQSTAAGYVIWRMVEFFLPIFVALPLLGLRSNSGRSIHTHWLRIHAYAQRLFSSVLRGHMDTQAGGVALAVTREGNLVGKKKNIPRKPRATLQSERAGYVQLGGARGAKVAGRRNTLSSAPARSQNDARAVTHRASHGVAPRAGQPGKPFVHGAVQGVTSRTVRDKQGTQHGSSNAHAPRIIIESRPHN